MSKPCVEEAFGSVGACTLSLNAICRFDHCSGSRRPVPFGREEKDEILQYTYDDSVGFP